MKWLSSSTPHPPSRLAYPHLNQMLDSLLSVPVSSTSSIFTLPSTSPLPPISSLLPSAAQSSNSAHLPLLPQDAVATSTHLRFSALRQLTCDLQQRKPRHPKRTQIPPGEAGSPTKKKSSHGCI